MLPTKLIEYLKEKKKAGYPDMMLKEQFKKQGWSDNLLDEAFAQINDKKVSPREDTSALTSIITADAPTINTTKPTERIILDADKSEEVPAKWSNSLTVIFTLLSGHYGLISIKMMVMLVIFQ